MSQNRNMGNPAEMELNGEADSDQHHSRQKDSAQA
jgi:hypothetical protein